MEELFYRYNNYTWEGERLLLEVFKSVKKTPAGHWIVPLYTSNSDFVPYIGNKKRWVSDTSIKRYAYPTRKEAFTSFKARKARQIKILTTQLNRAIIAFQMEISDV